MQLDAGDSTNNESTDPEERAQRRQRAGGETKAESTEQRAEAERQRIEYERDREDLEERAAIRDKFRELIFGPYDPYQYM